MVKKNLFIITLLALGNLLCAQKDSVYTGENKAKEKKTKSPNENLKKFTDKLVYGGFIMPGYYYNPNYGNVFYISANPNIGYKITDDLTLGIGFNYNYTKVNSRNGINYSQSIYGPSAFGRYLIFRNAFAQLQYDKINQPDYYSINGERVWIDYVFAGGGYYQKFNDRAGLVFSVLYNLTPNKNSIYQNPLIQIGFIGGF